MEDLQREAEFPIGKLGVGDVERAVADRSTARQRKRPAYETCGLGKPPAGPTRPRFQDFAGVDDRLPAGEALAEAAADCEREREPFLFRHQRAEAEIT